MFTELGVSIEKKKDKVFLKRLQLFFDLFVKEKRKSYLNTKGALHTFLAVTSEGNTCLMGHGDLTLCSHSARYY